MDEAAGGHPPRADRPGPTTPRLLDNRPASFKQILGGRGPPGSTGRFRRTPKGGAGVESVEHRALAKGNVRAYRRFERSGFGPAEVPARKGIPDEGYAVHPRLPPLLHQPRTRSQHCVPGMPALREGEGLTRPERHRRPWRPGWGRVGVPERRAGRVPVEAALTVLQDLFADGPTALGGTTAGRAEEFVGDPDFVAASVAARRGPAEGAHSVGAPAGWCALAAPTVAVPLGQVVCVPVADDPCTGHTSAPLRREGLSRAAQRYSTSMHITMAAARPAQLTQRDRGRVGPCPSTD